MLTLTEETFCNTVGETVRFKSNPFGWYYEVCPTCNKTNQSSGCPFQCNCSDNLATPITKYKIEIEVEYESNTANFVFWDKECIPYVGMSAHALRQLMKKTNEDHPNIYPTHLDQLLAQRFAFHVKYQPYYRQTSIVKITLDDDVYKQIEDRLKPPQATLQMPVHVDRAKGKPIHYLEENIALNTNTQDSNPMTTTSTGNNWSPESSINITPTKRMSPPDSINEQDAPDFLTPKLSATKSARTKAGRPNKNRGT